MTPRIRRLAATFAARPDAVPLMAAVLLFLVGAQIALVFKVPSWGNDEPAHVGYVASLATGHLPDIETDIVDDPRRFPGTAAELRGWDEEHGDIWTANHPPLFHLAMVPVWWALHDVNQSGMVIVMRLANTLGFALWLYLVGALARQLVPSRPAVPALAVVVAAAPTLVLRSAFFQTDGWASASAVLLLLMTVRMLRGEATPHRVGVAVAAGTVAAGTRAQGALVVALCAVFLLAALSRRDGWRAGVRVAALVGGVPAAASGWFFVRNHRLYGDVTGQDALMEKFDRMPVTSWDRIDNIPGLTEPTLATPILIAVSLVLVPIALVRSVRRHGVRLDMAWALLTVHALLTLQSVVMFLRIGGGFHDRYLMQTMPLLATTVAVGMLEVGRWVAARAPGTPAEERRDWWVASAWAAVLLVWLAGAVAWLEDYYVFSRQETSPVDGPVPDLMVLLAVGAGVAVVAVMVRRAVRSGEVTVTRVAACGDAAQRSGKGARVPSSSSTDSAATSCQRAEPVSM